MKINLTIALIIVCTVCNQRFMAQNTQNESSISKWTSMLDKQQLATYFSGIFNSMGFVVEETNEQFTVHHRGDHFEIEEGINSEKVDYVVHLRTENIENMKRHGSDAMVDENESFRIMSVLFTPLTEASLKNSTMSSPLMRKTTGIENHIHVNLISPDAKDTVSHTLIYLNKEWMVIPGKYGRAKRIFNLSQQDAIDYQKKMFVALKTDTMKGWKEFKKWYLEWRKGVSLELLCD